MKRLIGLLFALVFVFSFAGAQYQRDLKKGETYSRIIPSRELQSTYRIMDDSAQVQEIVWVLQDKDALQLYSLHLEFDTVATGRANPNADIELICLLQGSYDQVT